MDRACCTDLHRIYIGFSDKTCDIFHIFFCVRFRNNAHDHACESASMHSAAAIADLFQIMARQCKCERNLLLFIIPDRVAVLQELKGRTT